MFFGDAFSEDGELRSFGDEHFLSTVEAALGASDIGVGNRAGFGGEGGRNTAETGWWVGISIKHKAELIWGCKESAYKVMPSTIRKY